MPITRRTVKGSELTFAEGDGNLDALDRLSPAVLPIVSGAITITGPGTYRLQPETGTTDDLTTINGGVGHEWAIKLRVATVGHVITVKHSTGTGVYLAGGADFLLNSVRDMIVLQDREPGEWSETSRSSVP